MDMTRDINMIGCITKAKWCNIQMIVVCCYCCFQDLKRHCLKDLTRSEHVVHLFSHSYNVDVGQSVH